MPLTPGTRLGPYEIVSPLGGGGMGEVFRARDTRLDRMVAIKTLRPEFSADPERRARFEREARAIGALTHPHICPLYDVGSARLTTVGGEETIEFLVMELLDGETLEARLSRGPMPLAQTIVYSVQIAEALHHAHRLGIVHRDLKPSNIMITGSSARLLDFGLARLRSDLSVGAPLATQTAALTAQGTFLGTLQYIAPEQLEGREVDGRADLFAFGAILYEMVTGRRAFEAGSPAALISAILQSQPERLTAINPTLPPSLDRFVMICLSKNPDDRWASAHDLGLMLKGIGDESAGSPAPGTTRRSRRREWIAWAVAVFAVLVALIFAARQMMPRPAAALDIVSMLPPDTATLTAGEAPVVSPDGRHVAFVATDNAGTTLLYVRDRDVLPARALVGTDDATLPFWSPDSANIGFFAGGKLKRVRAAGGPPQTLANAAVPRGGTWNRSGVILFVPYPNQPVHKIGPDGVATPLPTSVEESRWFPTFLPDGRHYVYLSVALPNRSGGMLRVGTIDSPGTKDLVISRASGAYVEPGYLLYRREESLVAQPLDTESLQLTGTAVTILDQVGFNPITYQAQFSASSNGVLASLDAMPVGQLVWFDKLGRRLGSVAQPSGYNSLCFSGDGKRIVYDIADVHSGGVDIWALDLPDGTPSRLTSDPAVDFYVTCSPSGSDVVFASLRQGIPSLYRENTSAPGSEQLLQKMPGPSIPSDWSHDGQSIVFSTFSPKTNWDIWMVPAGGGQPVPFAVTGAEERTGRLSPDGRWMAYTMDQGSGDDIWVQAVPPTPVKWQISQGGGGQAVWHPNGRQLYYLSPRKQIIAVDVNPSGSTFATGGSHVIVDARVAGWERGGNGSPYGITPDGERFLVSTAAVSAQPMTLMFNWPSKLAR